MGSIYRWDQELGGGFRQVAPTVGGTASVGLRIKVGGAEFEFDTLPPGDYLFALLQGLGRC